MTASLLHEITRFTAQAFVAGLWQGIVLIATVAIGLRLFPRLSASIRFAIWSLTFALAATLPLLHLQIPAISAAQSHPTPIHLSAAWGTAIAAIWAIAMVSRIAQLLTQATRLHRIWKRATPVAAGEMAHALLNRGKRPTQLCTSPDIDVPCVIGFRSPRLLIPDWLFAKVTESELHQIILHEWEHLRRRDDWMNLLQKIALVLFPLNPALLWVDRRLSLERELACDAGVVASTAPFDYAHCLTRLAEHRLHRRSLALALSAWSRQSELARRIHTLLRPMRTMSPLQARASIAVLTLGLATGAVEMARAPHLISFTDTISAPIQQAATTISQPTAHAIPVSFMQTSQPHETLLKAVMPQPATPKTAHKTHSQPRLIQTSTPQPTVRGQYRPRRVSVQATYILTDFSPSYAAVPFGNGWLIIQL